MADQIITRAEACAQGLNRYFTGKTCKRGHVCERYTCNLECVQCVHVKTKAREWHRKNPERHRENCRRDYQKRKGDIAVKREANRDKSRAYFKERWHSIPLEERKERKRKWYDANREKAIAYTAQWERDNPEQAKAIKEIVSHRRRTRIRKSDGSFTQADLKAILSAQSHKCAYCRIDLRKAKRHLDHIMPLVLGGSNDKTNLQYLCAGCNLSKGAKHPIAFAQELGRLL